MSSARTTSTDLGIPKKATTAGWGLGVRSERSERERNKRVSGVVEIAKKKSDVIQKIGPLLVPLPLP